MFSRADSHCLPFPRPHFDSVVLVVEFPETDLGSFATRNLSLARDGLAIIVHDHPQRHVVLDLSRVKNWGASFLGMLAVFARQLREQGRSVTVRGDHLGLLKATGLDERIELASERLGRLRFRARD